MTDIITQSQLESIHVSLSKIINGTDSLKMTIMTAFILLSFDDNSGAFATIRL